VNAHPAPLTLIELLAVHRAGEDRFWGAPSRLFTRRIYGGDVAAQALMAAAATVAPNRPPHSVHVHFLRPGDPLEGVDYAVERVRESRSLSTRLVRASQGKRTVALATASFHVVRTGPRHQVVPEPAPDPHTLTSRAEHFARVRKEWPDDGTLPPELLTRDWPIDVRYIDLVPSLREGTAEPSNRSWIRVIDALPNDANLHAAALTFATDMQMWEPGLFPHPIGWVDSVSDRAWFGSSLDHTLFFHQPLRADEWLLMTQVNPVAAGSRVMAEARIYTRDGLLVATIAQESVLSPPDGF
jgi:acyl-CoA thioesterase-2